MARTAADRPSANNGPAQEQEHTGAGAALTRKRTNTAGASADGKPKTSRMDTEDEPMGGRPRLSKANQELFDLMTVYMDQKFENMGARFDSVKEEVTQNTGAIKMLATEVGKNKTDIVKINSQLKDMKKKDGGGLAEEARIEKIIEKVLDKRSPVRGEAMREEVKKINDDLSKLKNERAASSDVTVDTSEFSSQYWFARRSVRCWPVAGNSREELLVSLADFFGTKLRIPSGELLEDDIVEIRRIQARSRPSRLGSGADHGEGRIRDEVLVVLRDVGARDLVFRQAGNLAASREGKHPNSVGLRLQIPTHLLGKFNTLNQHGFDLKRKYGDGLKRHIKFDDMELDLVMDVRLPEGEEWIRVDYGTALAETRTLKKKRFPTSRGRLSSLQQENLEKDTSRSDRTLSVDSDSLNRKQQQLTTVRRGTDDVFVWGRST